MFLIFVFLLNKKTILYIYFLPLASIDIFSYW